MVSHSTIINKGLVFNKFVCEISRTKKITPTKACKKLFQGSKEVPLVATMGRNCLGETTPSKSKTRLQFKNQIMYLAQTAGLCARAASLIIRGKIEDFRFSLFEK